MKKVTNLSKRQRERLEDWKHSVEVNGSGFDTGKIEIKKTVAHLTDKAINDITTMLQERLEAGVEENKRHATALINKLEQ